MVKFQKIKLLLDNYLLVLVLFVSVNFLFDFIDKIEIYYQYDFLKFNRYLKLVFVVYNVYFICKNKEFVVKKTGYALGAFVLISIFFVFKNNFSSTYLNEYFRYAFGLITLPLICYVHVRQPDKIFPTCYKLFKYLILLNFFAVVFGVIFKIHVFRSYEYFRLGYNGFLLSQGVTPYVYLTATIIFWVMNDKRMLFLTFLLSLFSGIKGVYFVEFVALVLLTLTNRRISKNVKLGIGFLLSIAFLIVLIVIFRQPVFKEILKLNGILSAVFSLRTDNTLELFEIINHENFNYLIGATALEKVRVELQFLDIYIFFGVLGLMTYLFFLMGFYKKNIKSNAANIFFIVAISVSILVGNLFYIPVSSVLFFLTLFALKSHKEIEEKRCGEP